MRQKKRKSKIAGGNHAPTIDVYIYRQNPEIPISLKTNKKMFFNMSLSQIYLFCALQIDWNLQKNLHFYLLLFQRENATYLLRIHQDNDNKILDEMQYCQHNVMNDTDLDLERIKNVIIYNTKTALHSDGTIRILNEPIALQHIDIKSRSRSRSRSKSISPFTKKDDLRSPSLVQFSGKSLNSLSRKKSMSDQKSLSNSSLPTK